MKSKKEEEREILEQVYKKEFLQDSVWESETPDFIILDKVNSKRIGVEITTIYNSKAGPISISEKFAKPFIENNKPGKIQKKKIPKTLENLGVAKIEGIKGPFHDDYVIYERIYFKDYLQFIEDVIENKSKSYEKTPDNLEFVNLVAKDKTSSLKTRKFHVGELYGLIRQHSLFETIIKSNFQEIHFITPLKSGLYSIPLKWYIVQSEHHIFAKFWKESPLIQEFSKDDVINRTNNFIIMLIHLGFNKIFLNSENHFRYIIFGNHYFKLDTKAKVIDEVGFLAMELSNMKEAKEVFKTYKKYSKLFKEYQEFRKTISTNFPDEVFRKLD